MNLLKRVTFILLLMPQLSWGVYKITAFGHYKQLTMVQTSNSYTNDSNFTPAEAEAEDSVFTYGGRIARVGGVFLGGISYKHTPWSDITFKNKSYFSSGVLEGSDTKYQGKENEFELFLGVIANDYIHVNFSFSPYYKLKLKLENEEAITHFTGTGFGTMVSLNIPGGLGIELGYTRHEVSRRNGQKYPVVTSVSNTTQTYTETPVVESIYIGLSFSVNIFNSVAEAIGAGAEDG